MNWFIDVKSQILEHKLILVTKRIQKKQRTSFEEIVEAIGMGYMYIYLSIGWVISCSNAGERFRSTAGSVCWRKINGVKVFESPCCIYFVNGFLFCPFMLIQISINLQSKRRLQAIQHLCTMELCIFIILDSVHKNLQKKNTPQFKTHEIAKWKEECQMALYEFPSVDHDQLISSALNWNGIFEKLFHRSSIFSDYVVRLNFKIFSLGAIVCVSVYAFC